MDGYFNYFNSVCTEILDEIAPLIYRESKKQSQPWMNDEIRTKRKICRRAERKWKKDSLQVSFDILREALANFQSIVKVAKAKYV